MKWSNKRVLVTGAGGFIGSWLSEELVRRGANVKAFVRYNSNYSAGWLDTSPYKNEMQIIYGDIRDSESVATAVKKSDAVFHLASLISIPYSYVTQSSYVRTNIDGSLNVFQNCLRYSVSLVIHTSTSEVYGTAQELPISETHRIYCQSPYAATKASADQLALSMYHSFGLPVKIVRPFNTYGPRQSPRAVIPAIIIQILGGNKVLNIGNTAPTRDFTYVEDTVAGFLAIAESRKMFGDVTQIGTGHEISIENLVGLIAKIIGTRARTKVDRQRVRVKGSEVERLLCDNRKILKLTNWQCQNQLKSGLQKTIEWFRENHHSFKADHYHV